MLISLMASCVWILCSNHCYKALITIACKAWDATGCFWRSMISLSHDVLSHIHTAPVGGGCRTHSNDCYRVQYWFMAPHFTSPVHICLHICSPYLICLFFGFCRSCAHYQLADINDTFFTAN